jgi:predicted nucleic acid-binding protein
MARVVIADASPLIGLSIVDGLQWLPVLFGEVWIPETVRCEVIPNPSARGAADIQAALTAGWLNVWDAPVQPLLGINLDEGESACISIALSHPEPVLLIMDERAGRAVALEKGVQVIGTAAIIGRAKTTGLITSTRQVFDVLHRSDFRISASVIKTILTRVGE